MKKLLLTVLLFSTCRLWAATITATNSGNWGNPTTWGGLIPSAGDVAIIPAGITVTYPVDGNANWNNPQSIKIYGTYNPEGQSDDLHYLNPISIEVFSGGLFYDASAFVEFYLQNGSSIKVHSGGAWNSYFYAPNVLNSSGSRNSSSAWPTASTENPGPFTLSLDNGIFTFVPDAPLPVVLFGFSGKLQNNIASVQWLTGIEHNFNHFELQKSTDAKSFSTIATLNPKGDNSHYATSVTQIASVAYYRLKIIDNSGTFSYSQVVKLLQNGKNTLSIYPNPAKDYIHINAAQVDDMSIYNLGGVLVKKVRLQLGANKIDIGELPSGSYFMVSANSTSQFIKK